MKLKIIIKIRTKKYYFPQPQSLPWEQAQPALFCAVFSAPFFPPGSGITGASLWLRRPISVCPPQQQEEEAELAVLVLAQPQLSPQPHERRITRRYIAYVAAAKMQRPTMIFSSMMLLLCCFPQAGLVRR
ncbi:hypothetical protein LJC59_06225 [Desulfovibrio sp. OttesenSCG-928-A18]|nr:hypothetical protein [Desulfovibrio sp. OttesenSCG-928-A18]